MSASQVKQRWHLLLSLLALLFLFGSGADWVRSSSRKQFLAAPAKYLWPPWNAVRAYISLTGGDVPIYYEFTHVIMGEPTDLAVLTSRPASQWTALESSWADPSPAWRIPFRDFSVGYPPLSLILFMLPRLFAKTLAGYRIGFGILIAGLYLLLWGIDIRIGRHVSASSRSEDLLKRAVFLTIAIGPILMSRYDVLPAVLVAGALLTLLTARPIWTGGLLALAIAAKFYAALLLPMLLSLLIGLSAQTRRQATSLVAGLVLVSATGILSLLLVLQDPLAPVLQNLQTIHLRPLQIESLAAALPLLWGGPKTVVFSFGSHNVNSALAQRLASGMAAVTVLASGTLAAVAWQWARKQPALQPEQQARALCSWMTVSIFAVLATAKILSPQFFIWCLPLVAVLPGQNGQRLYRCMLVAALLTQICFPCLYGPITRLSPPALTVLFCRNATLVVLLLLALRVALRSADEVDSSHSKIP